MTCVRKAAIETGFANTPVNQNFGPHASTVADTDKPRVRRVCLLPVAWVSEVVRQATAGCYLPSSFYQKFIAPGLADTDPAVKASADEVMAWFRVATTIDRAAASCATVTPVTDRDLTNETYLKQWIARTKNHEMARLGAGGPS